jgi:hypothetical protein
LAALAVAPVVALAVACSGSGGASGVATPTTSTGSPSNVPPTSSPPSVTTSTSPATTASPSGGAVTPTDLPDGRHPARVLRVDASRRTVVVDVVQWFTGDAAVKAAAEDHAPEPENGYYIRNQNPRLRTLTVAPGAVITVNVLSAEETGSSTKDLRITLAKLARYDKNLRYALFWLTLRQGSVTRLAEQYLP